MLVAPRPLPLDQFKLVWETVHQSDKDRYWKQAYVKPNRFLCNQKSLNVKATRGKVLQALENDVELQGDLKKSSIRNGEQLALSMLFIELLILNVLNPSTSCHQYIGRAQFPKFKGTPPINHNSYEDNLQIERLSYWWEVKGSLNCSSSCGEGPIEGGHWRNLTPSSRLQKNVAIEGEVEQSLTTLLEFAQYHVAGFCGEKPANSQLMQSSVPTLGIKGCTGFTSIWLEAFTNHFWQYHICKPFRVERLC